MSSASLKKVVENTKIVCPYLFTAADYQGLSFPSATSPFLPDVTYLAASFNVNTNNFSSFYIPYGTKLIISGTHELTGSLTCLYCVDAYPYFQGVTSLRWTQVTEVDAKKQCLGFQLYYGNNKVLLYEPQSKQCDDLFISYCASNPTDVSNCSCIFDQDVLKETFPNQSLPVTCLGKNCVKNSSYQTRNMINETCGVKICSSETNLSGENVYATANNEMICGDLAYYNSLLVSPTATPNESSSEGDGIHLQIWLYVILVSLIIVVCFFIGFIIRWNKI